MATPRTCRDFIDLLLDYVDDGLEPRTRELCEEHMELCSQCADYLESYRTTTELGQRIYSREDDQGDEELELPEELVRSILSAAGVGTEPGEDPPVARARPRLS